MEKLVEIEDKVIKLKAHAGVPLFYRNQFNSDFFADAIKFAKSADGLGGKDFKDASYEDLDHLDMNVFYKMFWIFAKAGDKDIPPLEEWLEGFESLPLEEILPYVTQMIEGLLVGKKRKKAMKEVVK